MNYFRKRKFLILILQVFESPGNQGFVKQGQLLKHKTHNNYRTILTFLKPENVSSNNYILFESLFCKYIWNFSHSSIIIPT